jgi:glycosyltransferase involved in cell wall biosynthesis
MSTILFYSDVSIFGGHESTAVDAVRFLVESSGFDVSFMLCETNHRLINALEKINDENVNSRLVRIVFIDEFPPLQAFTANPFLLLKVFKQVSQNIKYIKPSLVVAVQGSVYLSFAGLLFAKQSGFKAVSFIPMGIERDTLTLKSRILDNFVAKFIYSLPDKIITICESAKARIVNNGASKRVEVIYCGVNINKLKRRERVISRDAYGMKPTEYVVAIIGRIQFSHKAQDFLVDSLLSYDDLPSNIRLYIVGEGSDSLKLFDIVKAKDKNKIIKILPWSPDLTEFYSAIDMLVIPSWHEGLPLVMVEAMYYEIPIVASNIDGMAEILPSQWLFEKGNGQKLTEKIIDVMNAMNQDKLCANKKLIQEKFNVESFGRKFCESLQEALLGE